MASGGVSSTMRSRRVVYDEYTNVYYVESRIEALERQIDTRSRLTNVLNRSQNCKLDYSKTKVEAARGIFTRKSESEMDVHKNSLRGYVAHRQVLDKLAAINRRKGLNSALGRYGVGCAKVEIQSLIDKRAKETTPSANRIRAAAKLGKKRKKVEVWDRTLNTPDLIDAGKNNVKNSRQNTKIRERSSLSVVFPTVKTQASLPNRPKMSPNKKEEATDSEYILPSVFITQNKDN